MNHTPDNGRDPTALNPLIAQIIVAPTVRTTSSGLSTVPSSKLSSFRATRLSSASRYRSSHSSTTGSRGAGSPPAAGVRTAQNIQSRRSMSCSLSERPESNCWQPTATSWASMTGPPRQLDRNVLDDGTKPRPRTSTRAAPSNSRSCPSKTQRLAAASSTVTGRLLCARAACGKPCPERSSSSSRASCGRTPATPISRARSIRCDWTSAHWAWCLSN